MKERDSSTLQSFALVLVTICCLLHHPHELFHTHFSVTISVCFFNHLFNLSVSEGLTQLSCYLLDVISRYPTIFIVVNDVECFHKLFLSVPFSNLGSHHMHKFIKINCTTPIFVHICNHLIDLLFRHLKTKCPHGNIQLPGINIT
uniref:Uncharacterized protein n=1 Tax=Rhizophora mucronata TaxID=61149 RepID=A0A2P2IX18_RHIMU